MLWSSTVVFPKTWTKYLLYIHIISFYKGLTLQFFIRITFNLDGFLEGTGDVKNWRCYFYFSFLQIFVYHHILWNYEMTQRQRTHISKYEIVWFQLSVNYFMCMLSKEQNWSIIHVIKHHHGIQWYVNYLTRSPICYSLKEYKVSK